MKHILCAAVLAALTAPLSAQQPQTSPQTSPQTPPQTAPQTSPQTPPQTRPAADSRAADANARVASEAEALAVVSAINEHEIQAAEIAKGEDISDEVRRYADMLENEHRRNQQKLDALARESNVRPSEGAAVRALKAKSKSKRESLENLDGAALEQAYIRTMIQDHTEALAKIDNELLAAAKTDAVVKHLRETRQHIARHLEQARELEGQTQASR